MIAIEKGSPENIEMTLRVARALPEWFTEEALHNIALDLTSNTFILAKYSDETVGFLCYTTYSGKLLLLWMGVLPDAQGNGVGTELINHLCNLGTALGLHSIEVETLPDEDEYEPYKRTRDFYYKNGFKRILYKKATTPGWDDQIVLERKL